MSESRALQAVVASEARLVLLGKRTDSAALAVIRSPEAFLNELVREAAHLAASESMLMEASSLQHALPLLLENPQALVGCPRCHPSSRLANALAGQWRGA